MATSDSTRITPSDEPAALASTDTDIDARIFEAIQAVNPLTSGGDARESASSVAAVLGFMAHAFHSAREGRVSEGAGLILETCAATLDFHFGGQSEGTMNATEAVQDGILLPSRARKAHCRGQRGLYRPIRPVRHQAASRRPGVCRRPRADAG